MKDKNLHFNNPIIQLIHELEYDYGSIYKELTNQNLSSSENAICVDEPLSKDLALFFPERSKYKDSLFTLTSDLDDAYENGYSSFYDTTSWYPFLYTERTEYEESVEDGRCEIKNIVIYKSQFMYDEFCAWIDDEIECESLNKKEASSLKEEVLAIYQEYTYLNKNNLDYAYFEVLRFLIDYYKKRGTNNVKLKIRKSN